jgi:hypothetical protein
VASPSRCWDILQSIINHLKFSRNSLPKSVHSSSPLPTAADRALSLSLAERICVWGWRERAKGMVAAS